MRKQVTVSFSVLLPHRNKTNEPVLKLDSQDIYLVTKFVFSITLQ